MEKCTQVVYVHIFDWVHIGAVNGHHWIKLMVVDVDVSVEELVPVQCGVEDVIVKVLRGGKDVTCQMDWIRGRALRKKNSVPRDTH